MNYAGFLRPVWWWLRGDAITEDVFSGAPAPLYSGADAVETMRAFRAGVPWQAVNDSWTLLDSHDTARFGTVAGSRGRHLVGVGLQMTTPGVPMIFAGDEIGLEGAWGEDARRTMPWGRPESWDGELLEGYRRLSRCGARATHSPAVGSATRTWRRRDRVPARDTRRAAALSRVARAARSDLRPVHRAGDPVRRRRA